jgi:hypothetical protein
MLEHILLERKMPEHILLGDMWGECKQQRGNKEATKGLYGSEPPCAKYQPV